MNEKQVNLVILLSLLSAISCNSGNSSSLNPTETNQTNIDENLTIEEEALKPDIDNEERLKGNQILENALKLLHKSSNKVVERNAYNLLEESAKLNNLRAKEMVAKAYLFGDHLLLDAKKALNYLDSIPVNQSSRAHLYLGFMYSMGLGVNRSQEKSLVHYRLAADMSNPSAKIAIAFRYNHGLGLQKSCRKALRLYKSVADDVVDNAKDFGGNPIVVQHLWQMKDTPNINSNSIDKDLLNYYHFMAKGGDIKARVSLGQLYYYGGNGVKKDRNRALNYFQKAAETGNGNALAFLGKYYLEGSPHIEQNYTKAFKLFTESAQKGNPIGTTELGLMYRYGKGVEINFEQAFNCFAQSSRQGWVEAILQLGTMYLYGIGVTRDYRMAIKYLTLASHSKHLLAIYNLGQLQASGVGIMQSCPNALSSLKSVAERGIWSKVLTEAYDDYENGLTAQAFVKFAFLSELGYELAQSNTAFIAENNDINQLKAYLAIGPALALKYWKQSAAQGSSFSRIKAGDYYYYGLGTPVDYKMAAFYYRRASENRYSGQALFNLGYLSEKGRGVDKNLKMAKIYYDMSAQVDKEAKVAVFLAKLKLNTIETTEKIVEWIDLRQYFGKNFDLVLMAVLSVVLGIVLCLKIFLL